MPMVTVVSNNGGWTAVERGIEKPGCDLGFSPYEEVFEAIGARAEYVEKPARI
jgi:thiamine pyrophosphate-dependent acetolactate synthase large subunit-like protein